MGTLFIVATPIGNLQDLSPRAISTLSSVDLIAAEDTRHTGRLLAHFRIETPLISYHAFNERSRLDTILSALAAGDVALVSDAGTPGISDPGFRLVAGAQAAGFAVSPIPGPSAVVAAVSASGLVEGPVTLLGFLPRQATERRRLLSRVGATGFALVLFESPHRVASTLIDVQAVVGDRDAVYCRELTKLFEEIRRGSLSSLSAHLLSEEPRGEFVVVVGPAAIQEESDEDPLVVIKRLLASGMKPSEAAREASALTGRPRSEIYAMIPSIKREASSQSG